MKVPADGVGCRGHRCSMGSWGREWWVRCRSSRDFGRKPGLGVVQLTRRRGPRRRGQQKCSWWKSEKKTFLWLMCCCICECLLSEVFLTQTLWVVRYTMPKLYVETLKFEILLYSHFLIDHYHIKTWIIW